MEVKENKNDLRSRLRGKPDAYIVSNKSNGLKFALIGMNKYNIQEILSGVSCDA